MKSYSQYSQDLVVLELLEFKQNGYFLDIGCSHPIKFSNTDVLEKNYNWNGLCVDAVDHTELYAKERKLYRRLDNSPVEKPNNKHNCLLGVMSICTGCDFLNENFSLY